DGDVLAYLNSDDCYLPGALAAVGEHFASNPLTDILHGICRTIDVGGRTIGQRFGSISRYDEILDLWNVWWAERNFVQPEVFWSRRVWQQVGPFNEDLHYVMDYDYWARILRAGGKVSSIEQELAAFRLQPNQKSSHSSEVADEVLSVVGPRLWSRRGNVRRWKRLRLQGDWLFDAVFRRRAGECVARGDRRLWRWMQLGLLSLRNPALFASRLYRRRVFPL